jgi:hypothetical protein
MTSGLGRIYAIAAAIVVFFLSWAIIAARPWVQAPEAKADHRLAALDQRNVYHAQLVQRKHQIAARKKAQAAAARAVQIAQQQAAAQPAPSYYAAPSTSHAAPAPSAPIVRVAPPAAPPATHTKTS